MIEKIKSNDKIKQTSGVCNDSVSLFELVLIVVQQRTEYIALTQKLICSMFIPIIHWNKNLP